MMGKHVCAVARLPLLAVLILANTSPAQEVTAETYAQCKPFRRVWWGMDLPGSDFRSFTVTRRSQGGEDYAAALQCLEACMRDDRCKAWTYVTLGTLAAGANYETCYLKDATPAPVHKHGHISSVKPPAPAVEAAPQPAEGFEPDTDRPGSDYRSIEFTQQPGRNPANECQRACQADQWCQAWTLVKPGVQGPQARCWLKNDVPEPRRDACCVSGVRQ